MIWVPIALLWCVFVFVLCVALGFIESAQSALHREVIAAQAAHIKTLTDMVDYLQWESPPENDPDELDRSKPIQEVVDLRGSVIPLKEGRIMIGLAEANKVGGFKLYPDGSLVVHGNAFATGVNSLIDKHFGVQIKNTKSPIAKIPQFKLCIVDPPYGLGKTVVKNNDWSDVAAYENWFLHCEEISAPDATICMWGGVGKPGDRPFLEWCAVVEKKHPDWEGQFVTWKKRRAYGTATKYLFTREECFILSRGKPTFNKPYLATERGYPGFDKAHPALSKYLRRGLVWDDVTELFRGKIHVTQKPDKLYEILIKTHSNEGDVVYDPCAGSGTTARACKNLNRRFVIVEEVRKYLEEAKLI